MRRLRIRIVALVLAFGIVLPAGASARTEYFCRMMGKVVAHCCCGSGEANSDVARETVRATDCCERVSTPGGASAQATLPATWDVPPATVTALLTPRDYAVTVATELALPSRSARAPPYVGPPLFILHCALLT
jgi:hypothetical protein